MALTLKCVSSDVQSVKVCIAAAVAGVSLKVQHTETNQASGSAQQLELLPTELTQANAILLHLGKPFVQLCELCIDNVIACLLLFTYRQRTQHYSIHHAHDLVRDLQLHRKKVMLPPS